MDMFKKQQYFFNNILLFKDFLYQGYANLHTLTFPRLRELWLDFRTKQFIKSTRKALSRIDVDYNFIGEFNHMQKIVMESKNPILITQYDCISGSIVYSRGIIENSITIKYNYSNIDQNDDLSDYTKAVTYHFYKNEDIDINSTIRLSNGLYTHNLESINIQTINKYHIKEIKDAIMKFIIWTIKANNFPFTEDDVNGV